MEDAMNRRCSLSMEDRSMYQWKKDQWKKIEEEIKNKEQAEVGNDLHCDRQEERHMRHQMVLSNYQLIP